MATLNNDLLVFIEKIRTKATAPMPFEVESILSLAFYGGVESVYNSLVSKIMESDDSNVHLAVIDVITETREFIDEFSNNFLN